MSQTFIHPFNAPMQHSQTISRPSHPMSRPPSKPDTITHDPNQRLATGDFAERWVASLRRNATSEKSEKPEKPSIGKSRPAGQRPPNSGVSRTRDGSPKPRPTSQRPGLHTVKEPGSQHPSPGKHSRHRDQLDRVYNQAAYDADFDRGLPRNGPPPGRLFNPDFNGYKRDRDDSSSKRALRNKQDPPEQERSSNKEKELVENEEKVDNGSQEGKTASRSSKESKIRRKREEKERRREEENHAGPSGRLFDHRKDDPMKFNGTNAGTVSLSSRTKSVKAASIMSTATNTNAPTDNQNEKSASKDGHVSQMKRIYQDVMKLENALHEEHRAARVREEEYLESNTFRMISGTLWDDDYWVKLAKSHRDLAEVYYSFLQYSLDPKHPSELHSLPSKYNIPTRLWQNAFHLFLERMRHVVSHPSPLVPTSVNILDQLIEFNQYAYTFYTQLYEDICMKPFKGVWIEQLGDLARYRMAVAGLANRVTSSSTPATLPVREEAQDEETQELLADVASIGEGALGNWELEEIETWRDSAKDWYAVGINEMPGNGRLHHHLGLLSVNNELMALYHYVKSLTVTHPYLSARESILPIFSEDLQFQRVGPDVSKKELFIHLQGMLFTKISLDNFNECMERFLERVSEEAGMLSRGAEVTGDAPFDDADWFIISIIIICSILQYGNDSSVLSKAMNVEEAPRKKTQTTASVQPTPQAIMVRRADEDEEAASQGEMGANDVVMQLTETDEEPVVFQYAVSFAFRLLTTIFKHPTVNDLLSPYITIILTFIAHIIQSPASLKCLERSIPWFELTRLFNTIPKQYQIKGESQSKLANKPLPEDWCMRGMEWTGKHLFSRGYWKIKSKKDDLSSFGSTRSHGQIESEMNALVFTLDNLQGDETGESLGVLGSGRWKRLALVASWINKAVPGFDLDDDGNYVLAGSLKTKLEMWEADDAAMAQRERERLARTENRMPVEEDSESESEDDEDENDTQEIKELKARKRELKAMLRNQKYHSNKAESQETLTIAGYTVLVLDTNIMLSMFSVVKDLIKSLKWTIVIPLAVITELDGLRKRDSKTLAGSAQEALTYLEQAVVQHRTHVKIQTSRGNYLRDLSIRNETLNFGELNAAAFSTEHIKSMDDVILRAVSWQRDHFVNRLSLVNPSSPYQGNLDSTVLSRAKKVLLISSDRNLRLKARARGLEAAEEKGVRRLLDLDEAQG